MSLSSDLCDLLNDLIIKDHDAAKEIITNNIERNELIDNYDHIITQSEFVTSLDIINGILSKISEPLIFAHFSDDGKRLIEFKKVSNEARS